MEILHQILAFVQNQSVALAFAFVLPFVWKYFPAFKDQSNEICTFLAALAAALANLLGATPGNSAILGGALAGIFGPIAAATLGAIDSAIMKQVHDHLLNPLWKALGLKKPEPTATA